MKILSHAQYCTFFCLLFTSLFSSLSFAQDDGAFLDAKYSKLIHPKKSVNQINKSFPANDTLEIISHQSPVRSQAARGTCSIFSATAYLEGLLIKKGVANNELDLSEEWLQYVAVRNKTSDGSSAWANFNAIREYGMPSEPSFPYIGEDWTEVFNPLKEVRCGKLTGALLKSCLIIHRDPSLISLSDEQILNSFSDREFINARAEAFDLKKKHLRFENYDYTLYNISEVKDLLQSGTPVILEADFYYGAWNHREAPLFGMERDMDHWAKGIVTFPEAGSVDAIESPKHPAGHSILIVGYDDNKIVQRTLKMKNGQMKTFTYKGVYYFKNSWGTSSFGREFEIDGQSFPGYGMMVQKYAEEIGQFYKMPLL